MNVCWHVAVYFGVDVCHCVSVSVCWCVYECALVCCWLCFGVDVNVLILVRLKNILCVLVFMSGCWCVDVGVFMLMSLCWCVYKCLCVSVCIITVGVLACWCVCITVVCVGMWISVCWHVGVGECV